jgi:DNA-binding PadR family transcriptional regulator
LIGVERAKEWIYLLLLSRGPCYLHDLVETIPDVERDIMKYINNLAAMGYITKKWDGKGIKLEITEEGLKQVDRAIDELMPYIERLERMRTFLDDETTRELSPYLVILSYLGLLSERLGANQGYALIAVSAIQAQEMMRNY